MSITYTWNVVQLDAYPEKDGLVNCVFTCHWTLNGDDGLGHSGSAYGPAGITLNADGNYTAFKVIPAEP